MTYIKASPPYTYFLSQKRSKSNLTFFKVLPERCRFYKTQTVKKITFFPNEINGGKNKQKMIIVFFKTLPKMDLFGDSKFEDFFRLKSEER